MNNSFRNCFLYVVFVYKILRVDQMQHYHFSRVDQMGIDQVGINPHTYKTTHRNKIVNVNKIKHIFIILVLSTKSVLKHDKTCRTQHT